MAHIDLNEAEADALRVILERTITDLRMEIADTDKLEYRERLKEQGHVVLKLLGELGSPLANAVV
jgi:hypothetical protein